MTYISFVEPTTGIDISIESDMSRAEAKEEIELCKLISKPMSINCASGGFTIIPVNVLENSIIVVN